MNKKFTALFLSIALAFCLFPAPIFADEWDGTEKTEPEKNENGGYVITSAAELAWLADSASFSGSGADAVLTADINLAGNEWTPVGKSNYAAYSGSFDGNGHTISGLKISSSAYAGLFGYVSGSVKNLTVEGDIQYSGYSTSYAGGIAGYNTGTIENCVSRAVISGKASGGIAGANEGNITGCVNMGSVSGSSDDTGGIAGSLKGGKISLCANYGAVKGTSYAYAGGIAGRVQGSASIENVYNTGDVSSQYAGGIAGYVYSSSVSINNTYSTGVISSAGSYKGGIAGQTGYGVSAAGITNCYFLKTDSVNSDLYAVQKAANDRDDLCGKTEEELKSEEMTAALNGAFERDSALINSGYPILKWQNPAASYKAVITVIPENASVTLLGAEEIYGRAAEGVYTFDGLSKGDYTYTVSYDEGDYKPYTGSFTISGADYYNTVELMLNTYTVSFAISPDYADFSLQANGETLTPLQADGGSYTYSLPNGSYTYTASAFGFQDKTDSITVDKSGSENIIELNALPRAGLVISLTDKLSGLAVDNFRAEIKCGDYTVKSEDDGSYMLAEGTYSYRVMASGYAKCTGEFTIDAEDILAGEKTIELVTEPSDAWDGDMDEPLYSDGAWQISSGNELAWFAGYVNGTQTTDISGASENAVLINDIDLGAEICWTPIGLNSYSNAYTGEFNGNGYTVKGLYIEASAVCQGLFGKITKEAVIKGLTVEGSIKSTSSGSYAYIGGVCGYNYKGQISDCQSRVNIISDGGRTGGICGASEGDGSVQAKITQCANYGNISYESGTGQYKGGIVGESRYSVISECSNAGNIKGNGNFTGGIAGDLYTGSLLTDCYNTGAVSSGAFSFGGIAGRTDLYGSFGMAHCYNAGAVEALSPSCQNYGALIGLFSGGFNTGCYCLIEEDGINSGLSAIGKIEFGTPDEVTVKVSAEEMRGILDGLNENGVWTQNAGLNNGYPVLLWQDIAQIRETTVEIDGTLWDGGAIAAGRHSIAADYSRIGENVQNGMLALAVYDTSGMLQKVWIDEYTISAEYDFCADSEVRIFFWGGGMKPETEFLGIDVV